MNITIRKGTETDYSVEQMKADTQLFQCFVAEDETKKIVGYAAWFFAYYLDRQSLVSRRYICNITGQG